MRKKVYKTSILDTTHSSVSLSHHLTSTVSQQINLNLDNIIQYDTINIIQHHLNKIRKHNNKFKKRHIAISMLLGSVIQAPVITIDIERNTYIKTNNKHRGITAIVVLDSEGKVTFHHPTIRLTTNVFELIYEDTGNGKNNNNSNVVNYKNKTYNINLLFNEEWIKYCHNSKRVYIDEHHYNNNKRKEIYTGFIKKKYQNLINRTDGNVQENFWEKIKLEYTNSKKQITTATYACRITAFGQVKLPKVVVKKNSAAAKVGTMNIQGINTKTTNGLKKIDNLLNNLNNNNYNIFAIQETFHTRDAKAIINSNSIANKYELFDMCCKNKEEKEHEKQNYAKGLITLIDSEYKPQYCQEYTNTSDGNMLSVSCELNTEKMLICNVYRNPSDKTRANKKLLTCHNLINKAIISAQFDTVMVLGDFNTKPSDLQQLLPNNNNYKRTVVVQPHDVTYVCGDKIKTAPDNIVIYTRNPSILMNKRIDDPRNMTRHETSLHRVVSIDFCNGARPSLVKPVPPKTNVSAQALINNANNIKDPEYWGSILDQILQHKKDNDGKELDQHYIDDMYQLFDNALQNAEKNLFVKLDNNHKKMLKKTSSKSVDEGLRWHKLADMALGSNNKMIKHINREEEQNLIRVVNYLLLVSKINRYNYKDKQRIINIMKQSTCENMKNNWHQANVVFQKIGEMFNTKVNIKQSIYPVLNKDGNLVQKYEDIADAHAFAMNEYNTKKQQRNKNNPYTISNRIVKIEQKITKFVNLQQQHVQRYNRESNTYNKQIQYWKGKLNNLLPRYDLISICEDITPEEVHRALIDAANHKAPGLDGHRAEAYKASLGNGCFNQYVDDLDEEVYLMRALLGNCDYYVSKDIKVYRNKTRTNKSYNSYNPLSGHRDMAMFTSLVFILNQIILSGKAPTKWHDVVISVLHKKGARELVNNYRPISLMAVLQKILNNVINQKLQAAIKEAQLNGIQHILNVNQTGYVQGRERFEHIFTLLRDIMNSKQNNKTLYIIFIDLTKAFDSLDHDLLIEHFCSLFDCPLIINYIRHVYKNMYYSVKIGDKLSVRLLQLVGIRQGDTLSPLLFILFFCKVILQIAKSLQNDEYDLEYADDAALKCNSKERCEIILKTTIQTLVENNLDLNVAKTEILAVNPTTDDKFITVSDPFAAEITHNFKIVDNFRYLGFTYDADGDIQKMINHSGIINHIKNFENLISANDCPSSIKIRNVKDQLMAKVFHNAPIWGYLAMQGAQQEKCIYKHMIKPIINCLRRILYVNTATRTTDLLLFEVTGIEHPFTTMLSQAIRTFVKMYLPETVNSTPNNALIQKKINKNDDPFVYNILSKITTILGEIQHFDVHTTFNYCFNSNQVSQNVKKKILKNALVYYNSTPILPIALRDQLIKSGLITTTYDIIHKRKQLDNEDDSDVVILINDPQPLPQYAFQASLSPHHIDLEQANVNPWVFYAKHSVYNTLYWQQCKKKSKTITAYIFNERNFYAKIDQQNALLFPEFHNAHTWYLSLMNLGWGRTFFNYKTNECEIKTCPLCNTGEVLDQFHVFRCKELQQQRVAAFHKMLYFIKKKNLMIPIIKKLNAVKHNTTQREILHQKIKKKWKITRDDNFIYADTLSPEAIATREREGGINHIEYLKYLKRDKSACQQWLLAKQEEFTNTINNTSSTTDDPILLTTKQVMLNTYSEEYLDLLSLDIFFKQHIGIKRLLNYNDPTKAPSIMNINNIYASILSYDRDAKHHNNIFFKIRYLLIIFYLDMIRDKLFDLVLND